jgi:hypothetical protein
LVNGVYLMFRYPLAGDEVGTNKLVVRVQQTWERFTVDSADTTTHFNGPRYDFMLIVLLAARHAWRQAALLGVKTAADTDPGAMVAALGREITERLGARRRRARGRLLTSS